MCLPGLVLIVRIALTIILRFWQEENISFPRETIWIMFNRMLSATVNRISESVRPAQNGG
jgi:hypothetical protein